MTGQILDCFRVNRRMDQICDVGMPEHMGCNIEIQAVNYMTIVSSLFP